MATNEVNYPYLHPKGNIAYVAKDNPFMIAARAYAKEHSLDELMPNASVIVKGNDIVASAANGSDYHKTNECVRIKRNIPTGQGYELCEGCHPKNHSESSAVLAAAQAGQDVNGAELYLWGHWWCCEPCWQNIVSAGITQVYLLEGSQDYFNKASSNNAVGRQFEI